MLSKSDFVLWRLCGIKSCYMTGAMHVKKKMAVLVCNFKLRFSERNVFSFMHCEKCTVWEISECCRSATYEHQLQSWLAHISTTLCQYLLDMSWSDCVFFEKVFLLAQSLPTKNYLRSISKIVSMFSGSMPVKQSCRSNIQIISLTCSNILKKPILHIHLIAMRYVHLTPFLHIYAMFYQHHIKFSIPFSYEGHTKYPITLDMFQPIHFLSWHFIPIYLGNFPSV